MTDVKEDYAWCAPCASSEVERHNCVATRYAIRVLRDHASLDTKYKSAMLEDPQRLLRELGLPPEPGLVRVATEKPEESTDAPLRECWKTYQGMLQSWAQEYSPASSQDTGYTQWLNRQVSRMQGALAPQVGNRIAHAPLAIELTEGCSMGCWFCGVSSKPLTRIARFEDHRVEFEEILDCIAAILGRECASKGFLYWGTDPFDNPDYELYLQAFERRLGRYPSTTTAKAGLDVDRVRRLTALTNAGSRTTINRASITAMSQYRRLLAALTPAELLGVEVVAQTMTAATPKTPVGRATTVQGARQANVADGKSADTIACVSGWLVNLCTREVAMITPTRKSEDAPEGYLTVSSARYESEPGLCLRRCLSEALDPLSASTILRFAPHVAATAVDDALVLDLPGATMRVPCPQPVEVARDVTAGVSLGQLVARMKSLFDVSTRDTLKVALDLYERGVLTSF